MKVQIASDLHIEYYYKEEDYLKFIQPSADILILAGDIGSIYRLKQLSSFLIKICEKFKYVVYIFGNCEFYLCNKYIERFTPMKILKNKMYSLTKTIPNLFILDRSFIIIEDYLISGCTLWSDIKEPLPFRYKIRDMTSKNYILSHEKDIDFIKKTNEFAKDKNLKHIVVTHHAPVFLNIKKDKPDLYMSDLSNFIKNLDITYWICGHIHYNFIGECGKTKIITNQRGKPGTFCDDYVSDYVIEI